MSEVTSINKNEGHDNISVIIAPKPLTVKDEYASLVPQISEEEYQTIIQSIKDNGQWVPIITNPQHQISKILGIDEYVAKLLTDAINKAIKSSASMP